MKAIPMFLKLFSHEMEDKFFYGNSSVAYDMFKGKDNDFLDFNFKKPTHINLVTLFEKGENVTDFEIYAEIEGELKMIYKQNRISKFRVCAVEGITTEKLRVKVLNTRKGYFRDIKVYLYNLPKKEADFRRTAYVVADNYNEADPDNIKHYNRFNIIGCIRCRDNGEVYFPEVKRDNKVYAGRERFEETLALVREKADKPNIVVTVFPDDPVKAIKNKDTAKNLNKFLEGYNLSGVSFDWEYPKNNREWRAFDKFIIELKEEIGDKQLTLALASWVRYRFSKKALESIDVAEVMTYDNMARDIDGHHSEFFSDGPDTIHHFLDMGFRLSQLDLGLPFYARPVDAAGYWKDYKAEVDKLDRFTNVVNNEYQDLDWKDKVIVVKPRFYNSVQMIEDKVTYCVYAGVGGVMVWSLCSDTAESHPLCLSKTIARTENRIAK